MAMQSRGDGNTHVFRHHPKSGMSVVHWRSFSTTGPKVWVFEKPGTVIIIGDQADSSFWRRIMDDGTLPTPHVVIDHGGHTPEQQRATLTALLPRMAAGGVYICEDIHGLQNPFSLFVHGFSDSLNDFSNLVCDNGNPERRAAVEANEVQATIRSVHFYPYMAVIEKTRFRVGEFAAPKHGTQWQPFLT